MYLQTCVEGSIKCQSLIISNSNLYGLLDPLAIECIKFEPPTLPPVIINTPPTTVAYISFYTFL